VYAFLQPYREPPETWTLQLGVDESQAASVITKVLRKAKLDAARVVHCPLAHGTIKQ